MDQVTQQNAAMVEETTAASMALNEEARALSTLVARFRVAQRSGTTAAQPNSTEMLRGTAERMRSAERPAPAPAPTYARDTRPAPSAARAGYTPSTQRVPDTDVRRQRAGTGQLGRVLIQ